MKLQYKTFGTGDPLIILHGLFGLGDNWRTIARMLESEYQCILVDLRNHGRSPHEEDMNFPLMAEDVHELITDLDLKEVILLGHSMGGKVAMQFATTYPELTKKLIVVDIAPKVYPPHHNSVIEAISALKPATSKTREEAETVLRQFIHDDEPTVQFLMKNLNRRPEGGFAWKANMPAIIAAYGALMDTISWLHPYLGPALFVRGETSGYLRDEDMSSILQIFPSATLETISKAGHWVHADNPEEFTETVRHFLKPG